MENEELTQLGKAVNDLTVRIDSKIEELSKLIGKTFEDQQASAEGKINKNPIAYMVGSFIGGVIVGCVLSKKKCCGEDIEKVK